MREYKDFVDVFVIVESDKTFSGTSKPLHYAENRHRFEGLLEGTKARIVYKSVEGLKENLPVGSFENEYQMRLAVSEVLTALQLSVGTLIVQSDVDEIVSKDTLELLSTCQVPDRLHLNVKNFRYGFNFPLNDEGYWRPHVSVVGGNGGGSGVGYTHGRVGDVLLENSGWHCTFCFATIGQMRQKMLGYSHNDRVRDTRIAEVESIRGRMCTGEDPFNMWPVSHPFPCCLASPRVASSLMSMMAGDEADNDRKLSRSKTCSHKQDPSHRQTTLPTSPWRCDKILIDSPIFSTRAASAPSERTVDDRPTFFFFMNARSHHCNMLG